MRSRIVLQLVATLWALSSPAFSSAASEPSPADATNPRYTGSPVMRTWTSEDLASAASIYHLVQHPRNGLVYVGTNVGVIELDGVRSRLIRHGPYDAATLIFDGMGRLWKGATDDIQVSIPDDAGHWQTASARERLPAGSDRITHAYRSLRGPAGVFFTDFHHLYHFTNAGGAARVWKASNGPAEISALWEMDDLPWLALTDGTVLRLRSGELERAPGFGSGALAARTLPGGVRQVLAPSGVDRWDGTTRTVVSRPLGEDVAQCALFLADGRIAFGTRSSGVIICDREGRLLQRIDRRHGLSGNAVRSLAEDREGGLWVALFTSVTRVQLDTPYARHGPAQGVEGIAQCFTEHRGSLYVGTTEGLFRRDAAGRFTAIEGVQPPVHRLLSHRGDLFINGNTFQVLGPDDGNRARRLDPRRFFGLVPLGSAPDLFVYGCNDGVAWARYDGKSWQQLGLLSSVTGPSDVVFQGPPGVIWARTTATMWRFDLRAGASATPPEVNLMPDRGLPHRDIRMFPLGNDFVALTQDSAHGQMLRYDEAAARFTPELRITGLPQTNRYPGAAGDVDRVLADDQGTIWLQLPEPLRPIYRASSSGPDEWRAEPLPGPPLASSRPNALWHEPENRTLWVASPAALMSRDLDWRPVHPPVPPAALIRQIALASGEPLFGGAQLSTAPARPPLNLDSAQGALRFTFAAPVYASDHLGKVGTTFRTRLDGLDPDWSAWTAETQRDFTNLPWRAFTFRVQARDAAGHIGPEGAFAFSVAAPWWGTRWAWAGYVVLGLLGVGSLVRVRTQALRHRAARLEEIIAQRTRELAAGNATLASQNAELARLHKLELDEKIAAQLSEEKARLELLRYQLNPHFLLNAFTTLRSLVHSSPEAAGQVVTRLADFCRLALTRSDESGATVDDEVQLIESYLDTEKARWRDDLKIELRIDAAARPKPLPPFLLQPLVENAIKYGGRTSPDILHVRLTITTLAAGLAIEIANTGEWVASGSPHQQGSTGIGLENLRQRLHRQYRDAHEFTTEARDGWVFVTLILRQASPVAEKSPPPGPVK